MEYGIKLELGQRTKSNVYIAGQSERETVIKLTLGHWNDDTGRLVAWKTGFQAIGQQHPSKEVVLNNKELIDRIFDQVKWPAPSQPPPDDDDSLSGDRLLMDLQVATGRFTFVTHDDKLCYETYDKSSKEMKPTVIANFTIPKILAIYQFTEAGESPMIKVLCRMRLAPSACGPVVYLSAEDENRTPNLTGASLFEVEVILHHTRLKAPVDVKEAFGSVHAALITDALSPDMLCCYFNSIPQPLPSAVIVRWGLQPSGWWVLHNIAFKDGMLHSVEGSGHAIAPAYFNRNPHCPMPTHDFPRIIVIPFAHVRYMIGLRMWVYQMNPFFGNNEQAAKAVFALAVLGLHADKCWGGQTGLGHGMPVGWIWSQIHGTGKTEACLTAHAALGFFNRSIWAGDATKSVTFEATSMDANLTKFIDDVVPSDKGGEGFHSKALAQQVRASYDRTSRAVTGKIRRPFSATCYTANMTVNDQDKAFQSRLVTIPFKAGSYDDAHHNPDMYNEFLLSRELLSALLPDLQLVGLWNGKLDKHAIQDWASFLQKALGKKRDRNLNEWAKLGYIFCLLNLLFQGNDKDQEAMFDWVIVVVTKATHELTNHAGVFDQFVISILQVTESVAPNLLGPNPDKVLHWHNMRKNTLPPLYGGSARYWAVRVSQVCHVIKAVTGKLFKENDIHTAIEDNDSVIGSSRSRFYNLQKCSWPIKKSIVPDMADNGGELGFVDVPLQEDELLDTQLTEYRCIFIKESYINDIRTSLERGGRFDVDYKTIKIESANPEVRPYNFFQALTSEGWFGYRSLSQGTFRHFCGAANEMQCGSKTTDLAIVSDVEMEVRTCGFGSVAQCFRPEMLLEFFNYTHPIYEDLNSFPACYTKVPFHFRNAVDDEAPPYPLGDMLTEAGESALGTPDKKSPPRTRPTAATGYSPSRRRMRPPDTVDSPLAARSPNVGGEEQPPLKRRRARASPSNHGHYPRPPDLPLRTLQDCLQWSAYAEARGHAGSGGTSRHRRNPHVLDEAEDGEDEEEVRLSVRTNFVYVDLTLSCHCPHSQEEEVQETAADRAFIDDSNHSQGDDGLAHASGKCLNVLDITEDGQEIICGEACNPAEQMCHWCRTMGHRMTGMF